MSGSRQPLLDTAARILAEGGDVAAFEAAGFAGLMQPEQAGGFGGDFGDAYALLHLTGERQPGLDLASLLALDIDHADTFALAARAAGALSRITAMSIDHANVRQQFGRPLAKFQAVQQSLAQLAMEAAAADAAGRALAAALDRGDASFEMAAAKLRINRAIAAGCALAHQVHGAIGFTQAHDLHRYTTALNRWRSQGGNDRVWAARLGEMVAARGAGALWPDLAARTDPSSSAAGS